MFAKALHYQPNLKDGLAQEIITRAKSKQDIEYIDKCLNLCRCLNINADKQFAEVYYVVGQNAEDKVSYYKEAYSLDKKYGDDYAQELAAKADKIKNPAERLYLLSEASRISEQYLPSLKNVFKDLKKEKTVKEMRVFVKKYGQLLSAEEKKLFAPPPVWQEVPGSRKTFIGEGMSGDRYIKVDLKKFMKPGCKIAIKAPEFSCYYGGSFKHYEGYKELLVKHVPKNALGFRFPKGVKGVIWVMRLL